VPKKEPDRLEEFVKEHERCVARINELQSIIPRLEKEREQILGMLYILEKLLGDGEDESKGNRNEQNSAGKRGNRED
jgi:hypothetical protein